MRSRNFHPELDERFEAAAQGRRHFLRFLATAPFAVQASLWLIACGAEQEENPYAGEAGVEPEEMPEATARPETTPEKAETTAESAASGGAPAGEAAASGAGDGDGDGQLVTEIAAMQPTVDALKYTHQSTTEGQRCDNCQFYTAQGGDLGKCQLFTQGLVKAGGWCSSWTKKIETG